MAYHALLAWQGVSFQVLLRMYLGMHRSGLQPGFFTHFIVTRAWLLLCKHLRTPIGEVTATPGAGFGCMVLAD